MIGPDLPPTPVTDPPDLSGGGRPAPGPQPVDGAWWEALFFASPVATCLVRVADGAVLALNDAWVRITGVPREVAMRSGVSAFDGALRCPLAGPNPAPTLRRLSVLAGGTVCDCDLRVSQWMQGEEWMRLAVLVEASPPVVPAPGVLPPSPEGSDHAREVLLQQARLHPAVEKLARVGHWTTAPNAQEVIWSPGLYEIAGLPPRDILMRVEGRAGLHAEDRDAWHAARDALDGQELEYRWWRPDGALRWLRTRMGRTVFPGHDPVDFGVVQDITDERAAQTALSQQVAFLRDVAQHLPGAIFRTRRGPDGRSAVTFLSESVRHLLEVEAEVVIADSRLLFRQIRRDDWPLVLDALDASAIDLAPLHLNFRADLPLRGTRWIQLDASAQREADGTVVWHGFLTDVTESLQAAQTFERQHRLLQAVQESQATFIGVEDKRQAFEGLLASFLGVTESSFGFVAEVLFDAREQPFLRMQAITDISWDSATRKVFEAAGKRGFEFHNLDTLFGHTLRTGDTVISNDPAHDPRAGGLPRGHPPLNSFLGVPISVAGKLVAMVGLANTTKAGGFDASDVAFLQPLFGTVRDLVMASRAHAERRRARLQFETTSVLLKEKSAALELTFDSMNQGMTMVDAEGRVRFYNRRVLELLDLPASLYASLPLHSEVVDFQRDRGDFGENLSLVDAHLQPAMMKDATVMPPERYVRRTPSGRAIEIITRMLPEGGFVRTYTDVTSYVDTQEALREQRQRLQWVLEATRPGIWEVNVASGDTLYSERWADMLGLTLSELEPTTMDTWRRLVHPDDLPRAERAFEAHLLGDTAYYECDLRMRHRRGHWMWVSERGRVHQRDAEGRALYMSGTLLDIHERVAAQEEVRSLNASLERRVEERTAELERSMKDMEAISYSIAHDLRAPLRSVNGFAALIVAEESERLSPSALAMFERIARSSRNMGQMITDMLELLRVVRVDLEAVPVDMAELAHSVVETLAPSFPNALIGIKPLPCVMGDATLLRQILVNLMDNALKYSRHRTQPELVLGYDERQRAFYLRDNGMGFDMSRAGKLFGLFQRMHAGSEVPGTGVGLAIVARIVERHGGRIWADTTPDQGATFWWTLPRV